MPEPMIIADPELRRPEGEEYWTSPEMDHPTWFIAEVAKSFFGMSPGWVRHHLRQRYECEGEPFEPPRTPSGDRVFRLWDIERWAYCLADHQIIDGRHLELSIQAVKTTAQLHGFIS